MSATPTLCILRLVESSIQRKYTANTAQTFPCGFRTAKVHIIFYMCKGKSIFLLTPHRPLREGGHSMKTPPDPLIGGGGHSMGTQKKYPIYLQ